MTDVVAPVRLSVADAVAKLAAADAVAACSTLAGVAPLIVELDSAAHVDGRALDRALRALQEIPTPTVALGARVSGSVGELLAERCDLALEAEADVERIVEVCAANPVASTMLVELLRHQENLSVHDGLISESLVYSTLQAGTEYAAWLARHERRQVQPEPEPAVIVTRDGRRLELELNRPRRRNAYSAEMRDALCAGLEIALVDESIEEIVIRGRGAVFSAGGDLDEFGTSPDPATAHLVRSTRHAGRLIAALSTRVHVRVHGACIGAGIELPAFASSVVVCGGATFRLPEVEMGLIPGAGGTVSIARRIGRQRTAWMALSGAVVDTETALAWGLIDRVEEAVA
jgi:enoyl-CoA hydratase/carnithine racemase